MQAALQTQAATVASIDPVADARYDAFVQAHPRATAYHAGAWARVLGESYGCRPAYLALSGHGDGIGGVLPLMYSRGVLSGKRMRGLPVMPTAGPIANSHAGEAALMEAACRLTDRRAGQMVVASRGKGYEEAVPELRAAPKHPCWVTAVPADVDSLRAGWKKTSSNLFRNLKKAEKTGVTVREGSSEHDLRAFYGLYLDTMKRHRTLPRAWRQMVLDRELLGPSGAFRLFLAEHEGRPVAAGLFHAYGDTVDLLYNGSDLRERDLRANFALYWHAIRWAAENGFGRFDWGEAQEGGNLSRFKAQWSAEPVPEYRYDYAPGTEAQVAAPSRADRIRHQHDRLDDPDVTSRRDELLDAAWERVPPKLTQAAGRLVYRFF
jgi:hypothetical protein